MQGSGVGEWETGDRDDDGTLFRCGVLFSAIGYCANEDGSFGRRRCEWFLECYQVNIVDNERLYHRWKDSHAYLEDMAPPTQ